MEHRARVDVRLRAARAGVRGASGVAGRYHRLPRLGRSAAGGSHLRRAARGAGRGADHPCQRWPGTCPDDRPMRIGIIAPQGWTGEYDGWEPERAGRRTVAVAQQAERLGFESVWLFDHFHTVPRPTDEITFESFASLSALAALTER